MQTVGLTGVTRIAGGGLHSLALTSDTTVWAWGDNSFGQLGDGTYDAHLTPVEVADLSGVVQVAGGYSHSLALKSDGTVWTWGGNYSGQLGDGTIPDRLTPVQVSGLSGVVAVVGGYYHSLALKSDGTVWAWGDNGDGQLGDGTTTSRTTAVQVSGLSGVGQIAGGGDHSLALKSDGTVWAWGDNYDGQLGDGTYYDRNTPVQVVGLSGVVQIAAGYWHSLAIEINRVSTRLTVPPAKGNIGKKVTLKATLKRADTNVALSNKPVQFLIDGVAIGNPVNTNAYGIAKIVYLVPESLGVGAHTLTAKFAGDLQFAPGVGSNTLTINKGPVRIKVTNVTGSAGTTVTLKAVLKNASGIPLGGKTLAFSVNGTAVGSAVTNSSGLAMLSYAIPADEPSGEETILVTFAGDGLYLYGAGVGTLTIP